MALQYLDYHKRPMITPQPPSSKKGHFKDLKAQAPGLIEVMLLRISLASCLQVITRQPS